MKKVQLVLGDQLFYPLNHLDASLPVIMIEHGDLCKYYAFHQVKLAFFFSAMRHYANDLRRHGCDVIYLAYQHQPKSFMETLHAQFPALETLIFTEIISQDFRRTVLDYCNNHHIRCQINPSPMFLNSVDHFHNYVESVKKPFMKTYYERSRKEHGILVDNDLKPVGGQWSYDGDNRKKCPKHLIVPERKLPRADDLTSEVISMVSNEFSDHPGQASDLWLPVTRSGALDWWHQFKSQYFSQFGDYEDAIDTRDPFLFHSAISALLNIGLLTPKEIIEDCMTMVGAVPLNALEGFVRQVMGWREFIRGIYERYNDHQQSMNLWDHHRQLTGHWVHGNTGHLPLDDAIKKTIKYAYNHHIERLMIIGATMLCSDIHPKEAYRWFMEMYVDGADWVMGPNVFGMSQFSDGGIFATKPYICGSNYIRKMSHYGTGDWCDIADGLYWRFIDRHRSFFIKNPRMGMAVRTFDKMGAEKKSRVLNAANQFIEKVTQQ
jgi:deoxyribodipyrimidine photolyase-related protein